jgi:BarA-like signal transduction histidine kinase
MGKTEKITSGLNTAKKDFYIRKSDDCHKVRFNLRKTGITKSFEQKETNRPKFEVISKPPILKYQMVLLRTNNSKEANKIISKKKATKGLNIITAFSIIIGVIIYVFYVINSNISDTGKRLNFAAETTWKTSRLQKEEPSGSNVSTYTTSKEKVLVAKENLEITPVSSSNNSTVNDSETQSSNSKTTASIEKNSREAATAIGTSEKNALQKIRISFGNSYDRNKIMGVDYAEIQNKVNEIKKIIFCKSFAIYGWCNN